jgi:hypothetical protein
VANVGWVFVFLVIIKSKYLKIKENVCTTWVPLFYFEEIFKTIGSPSFKSPKRGSYEVGAEVKVCD